jgi:hypothetical protein
VTYSWSGINFSWVELPAAGLPNLLEDNSAIIATVSVYNAQVDSQDGRNLTLSFILSHDGDMIQSGIVYAVVLVKNNQDGTGITLDERIYEEVITLKANEQVVKSITYEIPAGLSEKADLWVIALNQHSSVLFGLGKAAEIASDGTLIADYYPGGFLPYNSPTPPTIIQNIVLDKNYYQEGDTAMIQVFIIPSQKLVGGQVKISLSDENNRACANPWEKEILAGDMAFVPEISVSQNCVNPRVEVSFTDSAGAVLDSAMVNLTSDFLVETHAGARSFVDIYFGIDDNPNGILDVESLVYTTTRLIIPLP